MLPNHCSAQRAWWSTWHLSSKWKKPLWCIDTHRYTHTHTHTHTEKPLTHTAEGHRWWTPWLMTCVCVFFPEQQDLLTIHNTSCHLPRLGLRDSNSTGSWDLPLETAVLQSRPQSQPFHRGIRRDRSSAGSSSETAFLHGCRQRQHFYWVVTKDSSSTGLSQSIYGSGVAWHLTFSSPGCTVVNLWRALPWAA